MAVESATARHESAAYGVRVRAWIRSHCHRENVVVIAQANAIAAAVVIVAVLATASKCRNVILMTN